MPADREALDLRKFKLKFRMAEPGNIEAHSLVRDKDRAAPYLT